MSLKTLAKFQNTLRRYEAQAYYNTTIKSFRDQVKSAPAGSIPFRNQTPEVQRVAWECLSYLCIKHKAKLQANYQYYGILVATATHMAKRKLGIIDHVAISTYGSHRRGTVASIKNRLLKAKIALPPAPLSPLDEAYNG